MHKHTLIIGFSLIAVLFVPYTANSKTIDDNNESLETKNSEINVIKHDIETLSLSQTSSNLKLDKIEENMIAIYADIQKLIENDKSFDWITPLANLCAVIFGALIGGFLSYKIQGRQTKFEISKSLMDWKVKQLSELYGPLYALLHQSNAVYRQMNIVLEKADSNHFRLVDDSKKADLDKKIFQILINDEWVIFRTITHIDKVYGKDFGVEKYFDELLDIGERMVSIIEDKAGHVREDQPKLAYMFGRYLAHYTVLRQLHKQMKESFELQGKTTISQQPDMQVDHTAAFPREIQGMVQEGYQELNQELNNWGKKLE